MSETHRRQSVSKDEDPTAIAEQRIAHAKRHGTTILNLSNLGLETIPESLWQLTNLERLVLISNDLTVLSDAIGNLRNVRRLELFGNRLKSIPRTIRLLRNLQYLDLNGNHLQMLPEELGELSKLQHLILSWNHLFGLPESIRGLESLQKLHLDENRLRSLPLSLRRLVNLRQLYLHGNSDLGLPIEILGPTFDDVMQKSALPMDPVEILDYYFVGTAGDVQRPLNEAKLLILGRGDVGKTSVCKALVFGTFDEAESRTHGVNIFEWQLPTEKDTIRLNVWDFGGQEIMHATHQFFLTHRSIYILVLDARHGEQESNIDYWLRMIESFGPESPILVVVNQIESNPLKINTYEWKRRFPAIVGFFETDCKTRKGIEELRIAILAETQGLPSIHDLFPDAWFKVRRELPRFNKSYIEYADYRTLCERYNVTDPQNQRTLISFLHQMGSMIYFADDPFLAALGVLRPDWATKGVYAILDAKQVAQAEGSLRLDDLKAILDKEEYPERTHRYLLRLMERFELSFSDGLASWDTRSYFIPELLRSDTPISAGVDRWSSCECLGFIYCYSVVLPGLIPRFIVRTHHLSAKDERWRDGVILKFEGNEALIQADVANRRVVILVRGPAGGRRRLLSIIRSNFEIIHASIKNPKLDERVLIPGRIDASVKYKFLIDMELRGQREVWIEGLDEPIRVDVVLDGCEARSERINVPLELAKGGWDRERLRNWAGAERLSLAVIFTDVIDSARINVELGDEEWLEHLSKHFIRADALINLLNGFRIKSIGDSIMTVFKSCYEALLFCIQLLDDTGDENIRIRAAVHLGEVSIEDNDTFGSTVNFAARLQAFVSEGGIASSARFKTEIDGERRRAFRDLRWESLYEQEIKSFPGKHVVYRIRKEKQMCGVPTANRSQPSN